MTGIIQSGAVTPGHLLKVVTDGVAADAGFFPSQGEAVLAQLLSANFNTTDDQQIALPSWITKFVLTRVLITNPSISLTTAVGGFYPTTAKGGSAIVANTQVYSSLTAATKLLSATLASYGATTAFDGDVLTALSIYFSLTTPQGVGATADIYLAGIVLAGTTP